MRHFEEIVPGIKLLRTPFGAFWSGVVLVRGETPEETVLIDSGANRETVDECLIPALQEEKLPLSQIGWLACTHCHGDHVGGHYRLKELADIPTAAFEGSADKLRDPMKYSRLIRSVFPSDSPAPPKVLRGVEPDRLLKDGELLAGRLRLIWTPGHDTDTVCWLDEKTGTLISGDSIQGSGADGAGLAFYQDLPAYQKSLKRLMSLGASNLLAAHFYAPEGAAALGREAATVYLQASADAVERYRRYLTDLLSQNPQMGAKALARRMIRAEERQEPEYLFLELYTVRAHLRVLQEEQHESTTA